MYLEASPIFGEGIIYLSAHEQIVNSPIFDVDNPFSVNGVIMSNTRNIFSPGVRARAVRMVMEHESDYASRWAAIRSISSKIGCVPETLNGWIKMSEVDSGMRAGVPTETAKKLKALERENKELRRANEILRKASAYFAQAELDRPFKR